MNIAFDAKRITHNTTGLGNYGRYLIEILSTHYPDNSYHLYTPGRGKEVLQNRLPKGASVSYHYPTGCQALLKSVWRTWGVVPELKQQGYDLYHGLSNELPVGLRRAGVPSVVSIHDLIFLRHPEFYKPIDRSIYNYKFRQACVQANRVIAISEMTKRHILEAYRIDESKIEVVYQGCGSLFLQQATADKRAEVTSRYQLPPHYILYVGSIEARKNLMLIVKALRQLNRGIRLIAIGRRTPYADEVAAYLKEHRMEQEVTLLSNVPYTDLPALYQMASLFVYPSFFEGFGIPIIEALHSHVPVIGATGSCLEEAGGSDSLYVNPTNVGELAERIDQVLTSPSLADQMREAGHRYVQRFTDPHIAHDLMQVYQNL